jgi:hypothetical protein
MGYESRLYVVEKSNLSKDPDIDKVWAEVIAVFNLCVVPGLNLSKYPETDCFFYDGDKRVTEDRYGAPLIEVPIPDMIQCIEEARANDPDDYRRWQPCLQLLKGFDESRWGRLAVLHYGY